MVAAVLDGVLSVNLLLLLGQEVSALTIHGGKWDECKTW